MKTLIYLLFVSLTVSLTQAQYVTQEIESEKLGEIRQIKIHVPDNYDSDTDKTYPLFVVFDGDYLFDPVVGNIKYFSYWEDMPESIVVGIDQYKTREYDTMYSEQNSFPIESGANFFEFVGFELMPYMRENYRVANFNIAVGHGSTANFIGYYLLKNDPLFQAYISISPDLAPGMDKYLTERLLKMDNTHFFYLATSSNDLRKLRKDIDILNTNLSSINNEYVNYSFNDFNGPTHYSLATHAIPNALENIFYAFQPITKKEYKEEILTLDYSPVDYLKEKYQVVKDLFGIDKKILVNDFRAISSAIEKNQLFEYYQDLAKLASRDYPETLLGTYYLARYYEEMGEPKKAYRTYKSGYVLNETAGITKDFMLEMAEQIKADFGF